MRRSKISGESATPQKKFSHRHGHNLPVDLVGRATGRRRDTVLEILLMNVHEGGVPTDPEVQVIEVAGEEVYKKPVADDFHLRELILKDGLPFTTAERPDQSEDVEALAALLLRFELVGYARHREIEIFISLVGKPFRSQFKTTVAAEKKDDGRRSETFFKRRVRRSGSEMWPPVSRG